MRYSNMYANHTNYSKRLLRQPFFVFMVPLLIVFEKLRLFSETMFVFGQNDSILAVSHKKGPVFSRRL